MRHFRLSIVTTTVLFACSAASGAFVDEFDNGVVQDSNGISGFWDTLSFGGSANSIVEAGGNITFTIGDDDGSNESDFGGASAFSNSFRPEFSFLSNQVKIEVRGIQFSSPGNPFISPNERLMRVGFVSSGDSAFAADDAVFLRIFETGVSLRSKTNETNMNGQGTEQASLGNLNGVGGVDLLLGPGTLGNIDYSLTAYFPSGAVAGSTSGSFAYDSSQWDQVDQSSRLLINPQELNVSGGTQFFTASLGSLSVTAVPEPSSLLAVAVASICCMVLRLRKSRMPVSAQHAKTA